MDETMNLYEKLRALAYETKLVEGGEPVSIVRDADMALVYHTMIRMRWGLVTARDQFAQYVSIDESHLEDSMTLVERMALMDRVARHRDLVKSFDKMIKMTPELPGEWLNIDSAPQNGKPLRLLGKRVDGTTYIETGRWENIVWSTERISGHGKPTHWMHLERLPEGYT